MGGVFILGGCAPPIVGTTTSPDLKVSSIQVPSSAQNTSATWTLGATIANNGTASSGSFTILYQLSTKSTLDGTATTIGTSAVTGLAAGGTHSDTWSTSYSISQIGTYWIFVTVDSTNPVAGNTSSASVDVVAPTLPDLKVSSVQVPSSAQSTSATWTLGATIANTGTVAGSFTILYQLSTKSTLDGTATTIGTSFVTGLAAGGTYTDTWSTSYSIAQGGTHWIFVTADSTNAVAESDETNNTSSASVPIKYPEIVIDTYPPIYGYGTVMTWVSLFDSRGDTTVDLPDLWNGDNAPYKTETSPALIAQDGALGKWGRIDFTGGLAPGTYYVRVRGLSSDANGGYGIRVLDAAPDSPGGASWAWYFTAVNSTEANPAGGSYEPDDTPLQGGIPSNPVAISLNQKLNRWMTPGSTPGVPPGDVDWFTLILP
jgi:hypothetical protein